jgi:hypothetical protein
VNLTEAPRGGGLGAEGGGGFQLDNQKLAYSKHFPNRMPIRITYALPRSALEQDPRIHIYPAPVSKGDAMRRTIVANWCRKPMTPQLVSEF